MYFFSFFLPTASYQFHFEDSQGLNSIDGFYSNKNAIQSAYDDRTGMSQGHAQDLSQGPMYSNDDSMVPLSTLGKRKRFNESSPASKAARRGTLADDGDDDEETDDLGEIDPRRTQLAAALLEIEQLKKENAEFRRQLAERDVASEEGSESEAPASASSSASASVSSSASASASSSSSVLPSRQYDPQHPVCRTEFFSNERFSLGRSADKAGYVRLHPGNGKTMLMPPFGKRNRGAYMLYVVEQLKLQNNTTHKIDPPKYSKTKKRYQFLDKMLVIGSVENCKLSDVLTDQMCVRALLNGWMIVPCDKLKAVAEKPVAERETMDALRAHSWTLVGRDLEACKNDRLVVTVPNLNMAAGEKMVVLGFGNCVMKVQKAQNIVSGNRVIIKSLADICRYFNLPPTWPGLQLQSQSDEDSLISVE